MSKTPRMIPANQAQIGLERAQRIVDFVKGAPFKQAWRESNRNMRFEVMTMISVVDSHGVEWWTKCQLARPAVPARKKR